MLRRNIYRWHRTLSVICLIPIMLWAASGLIHQFNKWVRPSYNKSQFLNGKLLSDKSAYALYIVEKGMGKDCKVKAVSEISAFNNDYPKSQKILPVQAVYFLDDKHSVAYVDTRSARIIRTNNDNSRLVHKWFGYLHAYKFINDLLLRDILLLVISLITMLTVISGVYVHMILKPLGKSKRKTSSWYIHRVLGLVSVLFLFSFSVSGLVHVASGMVPGMEGADKLFFSNVHMLKFVDGISPEFRFWLLFGIATFIVILTISGMVLTGYYLRRRMAGISFETIVPFKTAPPINPADEIRILR